MAQFAAVRLTAEHYDRVSSAVSHLKTCEQCSGYSATPGAGALCPVGMMLTRVMAGILSSYGLNTALRGWKPRSL